MSDPLFTAPLVTANTARFAFVEAALDRADALRDDAQALYRHWHAGRVILIDGDGRALADGEGALLPLQGGDVAESPEAAVFLGLRDDQAWFGQAFDGIAIAAPQHVDLRSAAAHWPVMEASAFAQARAVLHWQSRHRWCGVCAGAVVFVRGGWLGRCGHCGLEHYPRSDPAVIVAVSDGERLLLGRQASWPARRYSTLAGFVEPGETLEQTVAREVLEESGVRVRSSRYLASQPWPFPSSLMLGFAADAEPDLPQVNDELEDARWFSRDEVGAALRGETHEQGLLVSPSISISRWLIEHWYASM